MLFDAEVAEQRFTPCRINALLYSHHSAAAIPLESECEFFLVPIYDIDW
jgi:hypothetical protein